MKTQETIFTLLDKTNTIVHVSQDGVIDCKISNVSAGIRVQHYDSYGYTGSYTDYDGNARGHNDLIQELQEMGIPFLAQEWLDMPAYNARLQNMRKPCRSCTRIKKDLTQVNLVIIGKDPYCENCYHEYCDYCTSPRGTGLCLACQYEKNHMQCMYDSLDTDENLYKAGKHCVKIVSPLNNGRNTRVTLAQVKHNHAQRLMENAQEMGVSSYIIETYKSIVIAQVRHIICLRAILGIDL